MEQEKIIIEVKKAEALERMEARTQKFCQQKDVAIVTISNLTEKGPNTMHTDAVINVKAESLQEVNDGLIESCMCLMSQLVDSSPNPVLSSFKMIQFFDKYFPNE